MSFAFVSQGRIPGTDKWKPINENDEAQEEVPGALIIRIRENLDFGITLHLSTALYCIFTQTLQQTLRSLKVRSPATRTVYLYGKLIYMWLFRTFKEV